MSVLDRYHEMMRSAIRSEVEPGRLRRAKNRLFARLAAWFLLRVVEAEEEELSKLREVLAELQRAQEEERLNSIRGLSFQDAARRLGVSLREAKRMVLEAERAPGGESGEAA